MHGAWLLQSAPLQVARGPVIVGVALAYFAVCAGIGVWAARRTRTARDFFVAGQGIGIVPLAIAAMASTLSGFAFIGGPGLVYAIGTAAVFLVLPASLTNTLGAWVLGKRMRLLGELRGLITVPDAIGVRYQSRAAQGLSAVAILVAVIGYMATNVLALGLVVDALFGVGLATGIWIGTAITLAYSVSGGIMAGLYTDVMQGALMAVASSLVFVYALQSGGGMIAISRTLMAADANYLGPWGTAGPVTALSFFFVFGLGSLGQPHIMHKFYMLKDLRRLKWYPLIMTSAMTMVLLLYVAVGLAMKALVVRGEVAPLARADDATPEFLLGYVPVFVSALVFSGVAAAIMSTVNSFMSIGAAALTHDLPRAFGRTVHDELRWGRIWTVALSALSAGVALRSGTLVAFLGIFGYGLFASTLVPALAVGLNWRGATREGAVASITTGLVVTLVCETLAYRGWFTLPAGVTVSGLALVASLGVFFVVSWCTRHRAPGQLAPDVARVMSL